MSRAVFQGDLTNLGTIWELFNQQTQLHGGKELTICWNNRAKEEQGAVVINSKLGLFNLESKESFWRASGVPCAPARGNYYRRYRYYIFDMLPVRVLRREIGQRRIAEVSWGTSRETRNGATLAARALHSLRLDAGLVEIGVDTSGSLQVLGVNVAPKLSRRMAKEFIGPLEKKLQECEFFQSQPRESVIERRVKLGADPEFMLKDSRSNRMVMASRFFPRNGRVGCDARYVRIQGGGYPLAELRPSPSWSPIKLYSNIRESMEKALSLAPYTNVQWRGGSMPFSRCPIGGHIHFTGLPVSGQLLRALDNYLGLPLLMVERSSSARKRRANHGYLGDFRVKTHGGFEYRTPASWLVSPMITQAALCLARIVASEYPVLKQDLFTTPEAHNAFLQARKEYFMSGFKSLWRDIEATESYKHYQGELQEFGKLAEKGASWNESIDIRRTWHLRVPRRRVFYK